MRVGAPAVVDRKLGARSRVAPLGPEAMVRVRATVSTRNPELATPLTVPAASRARGSNSWVPSANRGEVERVPQVA